jgi:TRAP-type mannitol/chloroaromatic compound transport system permease large subunit
MRRTYRARIIQSKLHAAAHRRRRGNSVSGGHTVLHGGHFRAVVPYIMLSLVLLVMIIMFPFIATWLPAPLG